MSRNGPPMGTHHASVSIVDDDGTIVRASVAFLHRGIDGRTVWRWHIYRDSADPGRWETIAVGDDLSSGVGDILDPLPMLASLGSFLGAFAEAQAYPGSENATLFPAAVEPYAERLAESIALITDPGPEPADADEVLDAIVAVLVEHTEWDSDTLDLIATILRSAGRLADDGEGFATDPRRASS